MFVLLNGAFGVGKTTVAQLLARAIDDATVYDPERIGAVLQRVPGVVLGHRGRPDDFQNLWQWRRLIVVGARVARWRATTVIVPMAFSRIDYFAAFKNALAERDDVRAFCLRAPLAVIEQRLAVRAADEGTQIDTWAVRRAGECCAVHDDPAFGQPIDATASPADVAAAIRAALGR